jgi:hypothetical protein
MCYRSAVIRESTEIGEAIYTAPREREDEDAAIEISSAMRNGSCTSNPHRRQLTETTL